MKFKFEFKGIPSFGYTCYGTPDMELKIRNIIENEPYKLKGILDMDGFNLLIQKMIVDQVGNKHTLFHWGVSEIESDVSGQEVHIWGEINFESDNIGNLRDVNLNNEFKNIMLYLLNDTHGDCNYLDFTELDKIVEESNDDDGYGIVVEIEDCDVKVSTQFMD